MGKEYSCFDGGQDRGLHGSLSVPKSIDWHLKSEEGSHGGVGPGFPKFVYQCVTWAWPASLHLGDSSAPIEEREC